MMYFLTFRNTSEPEPSRVQVTSSDPDLKTSWPASFVFMNESKKKKKKKKKKDHTHLFYDMAH